LLLSLRMDFDENQDLQPEKQKIAIYSKWAILGFSIFFSPMVGSILLMMNLRSIGNKRAGYAVLAFGIVFIIVAETLLVPLAGLTFATATPEKIMANQKIVYYSKAFDILGAGILTEYFFKKYFHDVDYESKSIVPPLLVIFLVIILLGSLVRL
jgi:hypothetical protein